MELSIIVAISQNGVIGNKGDLPWRIPEDLKRFQKLTLDHPVIMGQTTFLNIMKRNKRPLPERKNIVLSLEKDFQHEGIYVAHSIREAIGLCNGEDAYVMGGGQVYQGFLPLTTKLELTRIHRKVEGDTYFPKVDWNKWKEVFTEDHGSYSFHTYERIS